MMDRLIMMNRLPIETKYILDTEEWIREVKPVDVMFGRGSRPNEHEGNIKFRNMVAERKAEYDATANRKLKAKIAQEIIDCVQSKGGRFLRKINATQDIWVEVDECTVAEKAKQALRQNREKRHLVPTPSARQSPVSVAVVSPSHSPGKKRSIEPPAGFLPSLFLPGLDSNTSSSVPERKKRKEDPDSSLVDLLFEPCPCSNLVEPDLQTGGESKDMREGEDHNQDPETVLESVSEKLYETIPIPDLEFDDEYPCVNVYSFGRDLDALVQMNTEGDLDLERRLQQLFDAC